MRKWILDFLWRKFPTFYSSCLSIVQIIEAYEREA